MFYGVVEFQSKTSNSRELAVVPLTWLIKNERRCYWPTRTNKVPLSIFVKTCTPPSKNWRHYAIFKVHFKTQCYETAEKELDRILAEYEELNALSAASNQSIGRKSVSSESSGSSDENVESLTKKHKTIGEPSTSKVVEVQNDHRFLDLTPSASSTSTMTLNSNFAEALNNEIIIHTNSLNETIGEINNNSGFQDTVLSSLASIQTTNDQILLTMQEILRYNKKIALEKLIAPENLPHFPLNNYDEFLNFEIVVKEDPIVNQYMVRRLAALGGSGIEGVTRRIMKYLIANQLGIQFNWKGRHNKIGFENTSTMSIVYEAAKLNFPSNEKNDLQIAWAVKEWLKHSATRLNQGKRSK